jgi:hypothetical protein
MIHGQHRQTILSNCEYSVPQLRMLLDQVGEILDREIGTEERDRERPEAVDARRGAPRAEDRDHQKACTVEGEQVDGGARDDLVRLEGDTHERVDEGEEQPGPEGREEAYEGATREVGSDYPGDGGHEHEPFEADVDYPAPLAEKPAYSGVQ